MDPQVSIRDVQERDLRVFYEQQLDPEATHMAAFPAREYEAFMSHWQRIMGEPAVILQTVIFEGEVAGNIVIWEESGESNVGYWLGKKYWGQGVATAGLSLLLKQVERRPLYAHVAKHNVASIRVLQKCGFCTCREDTYSDVIGEEGIEFVMMLA